MLSFLPFCINAKMLKIMGVQVYIYSYAVHNKKVNRHKKMPLLSISNIVW